jgi:hypothetical protein
MYEEFMVPLVAKLMEQFKMCLEIEEKQGTFNTGFACSVFFLK